MKSIPSETLAYLEKQLDFSSRHQAYTDCPYYPCHAFPEGQNHLNCLFCYCPFYPCGGKLGGGRWIDTPNGRCFDCSDCTRFHTDTEVAEVMKRLTLGENIRQIARRLKRSKP